MVDFNRLIKKFQASFEEEKKAEIQQLYNKIIDAVRGGHISNVITAMELVKQTLILQKIKKIYPEIFK